MYEGFQWVRCKSWFEKHLIVTSSMLDLTSVQPTTGELQLSFNPNLISNVPPVGDINNTNWYLFCSFLPNLVLNTNDHLKQIPLLHFYLFRFCSRALLSSSFSCCPSFSHPHSKLCSLPHPHPGRGRHTIVSCGSCCFHSKREVLQY